MSHIIVHISNGHQLWPHNLWDATLDTSQMKGGRMLRKKKSTPAKSLDLPPVEAKVEYKIEDPEVFSEDHQQSSVQPSTIQILFDNANIDGSISDSPETLALLTKLWSEIGNTNDFNLENIKTVRIFNLHKILWEPLIFIFSPNTRMTLKADCLRSQFIFGSEWFS